MAPGGVRVIRDDAEDGEILTKAELGEVRQLLALMRERDIGFAKLKRLIDDETDLHQIAEGKKASVWVWKQVGALAKWVGIVIGALVAWKAYLANGGVKP